MLWLEVFHFGVWISSVLMKLLFVQREEKSCFTSWKLFSVESVLFSDIKDSFFTFALRNAEGPTA